MQLGDRKSREMYKYLQTCAAKPYYEMLTEWVYEGKIKDPYNEFLISVNESQQATNLLDDFNPNDSEYNSNRYNTHFKKLESLEAKLIEKSVYLKPNSEYIQSLKLRIDSLRDSLSRPTEILVNYRDLKRKALRDEAVTEKIESQLVTLKLEKARQTNPWELITTPTLIEKPISTNKKEFDR